jgi:hypothetical protein
MRAKEPMHFTEEIFLFRARAAALIHVFQKKEIKRNLFI